MKKIFLYITFVFIISTKLYSQPWATRYYNHRGIFKELYSTDTISGRVGVFTNSVNVNTISFNHVNEDTIQSIPNNQVVINDKLKTLNKIYVATGGDTLKGAVIDTLRGLTLYGNASNWKDCKGTDVVRTFGGNTPDWTNFRNGLFGYTYGTAAGNVLDESFSRFQLDHDWDTTKKVIYPHFHLAHNSASVGATDSVYLCIEYSVANSTKVFPATTTVCKYFKVPTVQYSEFYGSNFSITIPNNVGLSPIIWTRWYRDQNAVRDNANYGIFINDFDAHYRVNSLGSNNELQK
jgi:hypothetical protein